MLVPELIGLILFIRPLPIFPSFLLLFVQERVVGEGSAEAQRRNQSLDIPHWAKFSSFLYMHTQTSFFSTALPSTKEQLKKHDLTFKGVLTEGRQDVLFTHHTQAGHR